MNTQNITRFFENIMRDLYQSVYLFLGGSLDDQTLNWADRGLAFAATVIKIVILLAIIGFIYWFLVYCVKHARAFLHLSQRQVRVMRAVLRYTWFVASLIAIMMQIGFHTDTVKATAKAAGWAGFYYVLWTMSGKMLSGVLKHYELNASIEQLLKNMILVIILVLTTASVLAQFGFDIVSLVAGLGIVGLAVGFAAQSTLANFIAGITILIEQSFQVGDWIRLGDKEGRVVKISLRATQILDRDNIIIIIPNATVASSEVVNLTSKKMIRFDVKARIALEADISQARSIIVKTLAKDEVVLKHPAPMATVAEVGESGVYFIVRFWVAPLSVARIPIIKENINEKIKRALDEAGIKAPYPHMRLIVDDHNILHIPTSQVEVAEHIEEDLESAARKN
ncbi:mechanosensitive ion channel protein MscS [Moraxella bovoculi]|uniref:Small-conductance mechanosensitive channel n=1 Tax=Moraxella bovoculi TaxID=386891 RepID=A0AAC8PWW6_9GAMM|nr:mechanosensitive ion channel family protein [Moraxella bovoculi]AKG07932.1 mechanosensitive ion channel protein MscS [Moraxella bovoculi]AKG09532.1 mechanosensitive ion channel protein MscS [Moraxella bovoculi]AKG11347.1 mechanosensitive ion channel protein MscS [Moraxella bovoculi]AKG13355.1 mechanosensitive ion channel protein MscS [Moraxella bovoculi]